MFNLLRKWVSYLYLLYELNTHLYMLEPWEKKFINSLVVIVLGLILFSSYAYLPKYTETFLTYLSPIASVKEIHMTGEPHLIPMN